MKLKVSKKLKNVTYKPGLYVTFLVAPNQYIIKCLCFLCTYVYLRVHACRCTRTISALKLIKHTRIRTHECNACIIILTCIHFSCEYIFLCRLSVASNFCISQNTLLLDISWPANNPNTYNGMPKIVWLMN